MSNNDTQPVVTAILDALNLALPAGIDAYDVDSVPGTNGNPGPKPQRHVEIEVARQFTDESRRFSGEITLPLRELTTRYHAESADNVRVIRRIVADALEDVAIALPGGDHCGPFVFRLSEPEDDDDLGWSAADHWTF